MRSAFPADASPISDTRGVVTTTRWLWPALIVVLTAVTIARFPLIVAYAREQTDPQLAKRVGDETLLTVALNISATVAIVIFLGAVVIYAVLGSLAERKFAPRSVSAMGIKCGVTLCTIAAVSLPLQAMALVLGSATIVRNPITFSWAIGVPMGLSLLFRVKGTGLRGWWRGFVISATLGVLLWLQ